MWKTVPFTNTCKSFKWINEVEYEKRITIYCKASYKQNMGEEEKSGSLDGINELCVILYW